MHDIYGKMHRWILNITDSSILVDHIDGNGLNNQKNNLRTVTSSLNKKNQRLLNNQKFHFNGISLEKCKNGYSRIRVRWSEGESFWKYSGYRAEQKVKSFNCKDYDYDYNKF